MTVSIRVATSPGEARIAVVSSNRLVDFALWRPGAPDGVGDIHRGRVSGLVPGMAGAFVALIDAEGFLPDSEGAKGLTVGTMLIVRITRAAQGNKGPRLSTKLPRDGLDTEALDRADTAKIGLLRRGPTPLGRMADRYQDAPIVVDDIGLAADLRLGSRVSVASTVFDDDVADEIDALFGPVVELPGGARLSIWPTPALVAIDVDAGGALAGAGGARFRHEVLNRGILPALATQIRLRNLSGAIVVDLAGLSPRKRVALTPDFESALANDPLRPRFLGFTALGLAEIVRSRVHPPLHELLTGPLSAGLAALRAVLAGFNQGARGLAAVRANPTIVAALQADLAAMPDLARRTGHQVTLRSDPALPAETWVLEKDDG